MSVPDGFIFLLKTCKLRELVALRHAFKISQTDSEYLKAVDDEIRRRDLGKEDR